MIRSAERCGHKRKNHTQPDNFTKYEIIITNKQQHTAHSQQVEKYRNEFGF